MLHQKLYKHKAGVRSTKVSKGRSDSVFCWDFELISSAYPKSNSCCPNNYSSLGTEESSNSLLTRERPGFDGGGGDWREAKMQKVSQMIVDGGRPQISCPRELWGLPYEFKVQWETVYLATVPSKDVKIE